MAIEEITAKPWELDDPERIAKFHKGIPGMTADIWAAKPTLDACWRGDYREWHIEDGTHYQEQLYCRFWEKFVNPSGFSCEVCKGHKMLNWQSSHTLDVLTALEDKTAQEQAILVTVKQGLLTEEEAIQLGEELELG